MEQILVILSAWSIWCIDATAPHKLNLYPYNNNLVRELVSRLGKADIPDVYLDLPEVSQRAYGPSNDEDQYEGFDFSEPQENALNPSIRDHEYLQHSSLWGHHYLSGGAGEGEQRLKPDGAAKNLNQVKTDASLPAYCNPPNPCPIGYTSEDGCLEEFENTAQFSRDFQAAQDCMCDVEHMMDCSAREFSHNDIGIDSIVSSLRSYQNPNPFLQGEMLPIAAKKGFNVRV
ncbi:unnamed protein product [Bemisia tabaci]|uniref:Neuroendocrine protein 7B2 n=1 Tax=Bemisia tabaci TaxID=7038 RepID=A0A9P0F1V5_BEMTA|nr:PREDICTED: neuroendocrine protein 7B2 isoform X2 [Bemisia tabaci]CAH0386135.1 unnamed protein product [Bemisia tabaci]